VQFIRFTRFATVGAVASAVQYLILYGLVQYMLVDPTLASSIGFVVSAYGNYILNYHYTFRSRGRHGPAMTKFILLASAGLFLNSTSMRVLTSQGLYYLVAQLCATFIVLLWNFVGNSLWTFRGASYEDDKG
jgi:putative flippase GtrA